MAFGLGTNQGEELARAQTDVKTARAELARAQRALDATPSSINYAASRACEDARAALRRAEARERSAQANMR